MGVGEIFTDIAAGMTSFIPALGKAVVDMFSYLFLTATVGADKVVTFTGFSTLGGFMIAGIVLGIAWRIFPKVFGFLKGLVAEHKRNKMAN